MMKLIGKALPPNPTPTCHCGKPTRATRCPNVIAMEFCSRACISAPTAMRDAWFVVKDASGQALPVRYGDPVRNACRQIFHAANQTEAFMVVQQMNGGR